VANAIAPAGQKPLQVSHLTRYLKYILEKDEFLAALSVEGEVCELSRSPAGHVYLTLKDAASQVACVLFRREAVQQTEQVEQLRRGVSVVVHGFLTVYEPRGSLQIFVERVIVQGDGAFARRFEALRARLEKEGLFAEERKRPLPQFPRTIALITSPGSQAYHDVLHRLRTQYPFVRVIEAGVSVQGDGAADEIALAIYIVNRLTIADVMLIVRGGGAPEDLAAFNDERLARAIFGSRIPVVTGIGHETDFTIADFVADRRAATPSLAAAGAVPDVGSLVQRAGRFHAEMSGIMAQRLHHDKRRWLEVNLALLRASPQNRLRTQQQRADELRRTSRKAIAVHLRAKRARLDALRRQLDALDPLAILARGYAVLTDTETGRSIGSVAAAVPGRRARAQVSDGEFYVRVTGDE
jgi:exodeoxyribonuclease VII large subunit